MYAILQQGGHQYRVAPGDRLLIDRLGAEVGAVIALEPVLLVEADGTTTVGTPVVEGARVAARVVAHPRGAKLRVFTYKPKKRHRRTQGYRSRLTELRVEALLSAGEPLPGSAPAPEKPKSRSRRASTDVEAQQRAVPAEPATAKAPPTRRRTGPAAATDAEARDETPAAPRPARRATRQAASGGEDDKE